MFIYDYPISIHISYLYNCKNGKLSNILYLYNNFLIIIKLYFVQQKYEIFLL